MACPTSLNEEDEYAAAIEIDSETFVVGFGLTENETLAAGGFTDTFVSDDVDGRRLFAVQLADAQDIDAVSIADGRDTRALPLVGN